MLYSQCCSSDQQFRLCAIIIFIPITCHMKVLQYTENDVSMQNTIHFVHICTVINPGCIIKATVVQSCLTCDKRRRKLTISYCVRCNKTHFVLLKMYHFCISKIAFGATKHFQHPYAIQIVKFRHISVHLYLNTKFQSVIQYVLVSSYLSHSRSINDFETCSFLQEVYFNRSAFQSDNVIFHKKGE